MSVLDKYELDVTDQFNEYWGTSYLSVILVYSYSWQDREEGEPAKLLHYLRDGIRLLGTAETYLPADILGQVQDFLVEHHTTKDTFYGG